MNSINPKQVFHYFNDTFSYEKAKKLTSVTTVNCICYITVEIIGHNKNYDSRCFKCQICKALISVLVERKRIKLLLFVGNSNYKTISDEELFSSNGIWDKF